MKDVDLPSLLPGMLPRLWAFALRISGDRHDAEDLLQRACVRALERAHQFRPDTSPLSWMFSIVHTTWLNELRARNVRSRSSTEWDDGFLETIADPLAPSPETDAMNAEIVSVVQRLPEAQRIVVLLVAVEGRSYGEAAEILDVPIGTIMSRLSRALHTIGIYFGERNKKKVKNATQERLAGLGNQISNLRFDSLFDSLFGALFGSTWVSLTRGFEPRRVTSFAVRRI